MSEGQRERAKRALADAYEASWTQVQVLAQAYPGRKPIYLEPQDFAEGAVDAVLSAIFPVRGADDGLVERVAEAMVKADDNYINTYGESGETAFSPNFRLLARAAVAAVRAAGTGPSTLEEATGGIIDAALEVRDLSEAAGVGGTGDRLADEEAIGVMAGAIKGRYPRARMDAEELREDCRVAYAALRAASAGGPE